MEPIRRVTTVVEDVHAEAGRDVTAPLRRAVAAAVVKNPWVGRTVDDLSAEVTRLAPLIADAPRPDEIVVALAASSGPRPFARIGDRTSDPQALATEGT
jgi:hypothetical protein